MSTKKRKKRRSISDEQKAEFVRMYHAGDLSVAVLAKNVGVSESGLGRWIRERRAGKTQSNNNSSYAEDREEIARLRREVKQVRAERDVLKKSIAFFAREST